MKIAALQSTDTVRSGDVTEGRVTLTQRRLLFQPSWQRRTRLGPRGFPEESERSLAEPSFLPRAQHPLPVWPNTNLWAVAKAAADTEQLHRITSTVPRAPSYLHFFCSTKSCDSQTVMIWTLTGSRRCTWAKQLTSGHTGRQWWIVGLNKEICLLILCSKICIGRKHAGSRCPIFTHNLFLVFITDQIWKFLPRRKKSCNVICTK